MMKPLRSCLLTVLMGSTLPAGPVELQVDQTQSSADVELFITRVSTACDSDTSPVAGYVTISLDCPMSPYELTLHDFVFQLTDDITLNPDFGPYYGSLQSMGRDVEVRYADPGNPLPPARLIGDEFSYENVPAGAAGQLEYVVTDLICSLFGMAGYPCEAVIDLGTIELDPLTLSGTLVLSGSDVIVTLFVDITGPIDVANPDLGTLSINAFIIAVGPIPPPCCPGDLTGDDGIDLEDHGRFVDCLAGPDAAPDTVPPAPCPCADLDGDDDVDLRDFADFQRVFEGP